MSINNFYAFLFLTILISSVYNTIIILDNDNYDNEVNSSKEIWLIEYYSEKCSTCQEFAPVWEQLAKKVDYLKIGRVNIDTPKGMELATKNDALNNGIPCIRLIYGKNKFENVMTGSEEPLPKVKTLKDRIDNILKTKGKLENGKYFMNEDL